MSVEEITKDMLSGLAVGERRYIETTFDDQRPVIARVGVHTPHNMAFHAVPFCAVAATDNGYISRTLMCIERIK